MGFIKCEKCGKTFDYDKYYGLCPKCGRYNREHKDDDTNCFINGEIDKNHIDAHKETNASYSKSYQSYEEAFEETSNNKNIIEDEFQSYLNQKNKNNPDEYTKNYAEMKNEYDETRQQANTEGLKVLIKFLLFFFLFPFILSIIMPLIAFIFYLFI